jgi:hypothetical protein
LKGDKMKCPECGCVEGDPSIALLGQSMCPNCGNIMEFTDIISNEVSDEVNGAEYYYDTY